MLAEVEERISGNNSLPPIPEVSGVVPPRKRRLSDSYFKLVGESWTPPVIDDSELPVRILSGGRRIGWRWAEPCNYSHSIRIWMSCLRGGRAELA